MKRLKKIKNKLKSNKILLLLGGILVVCFILILVALFKYFYGAMNNTKYGDRLDGISEYKLDKGLDSEIKDLYSESEVDSVTLKTSGKIIYLTIDLSKVVTKETAKTLALKALEKFTDDEKQYYDIQFIITCSKEEGSEETKLYPIMGYKNSSSAVVSWIKD